MEMQRTAIMANSCVVGIDLGTTTVKVAVLDAVSKVILGSWSCETKAAVSNEKVPSANEQDVSKIMHAVGVCMAKISPCLLSKVVGIGICGQMHGLVLWKRGIANRNQELLENGIVEQFSKVSHLYTWQDGRCSTEFLSSLPLPRSHLRIATGFGCATIHWLVHHDPDQLEAYDCAGTVQDFLVAGLCGLDEPVMSTQNAASWGYFDTTTNSWNADELSKSGFPVRLLPKVVEPGEKGGVLAYQWFGIPGGVPVTAAMGDLQCYVLSKLQSDCDAVINVGTSAQFTFIMPEDYSPESTSDEDRHSSPVEYCPYFNGRYLAEVASLNGGNSLAAFVTALCHWLEELDISADESLVWEKIGRFVGNEDEPCSLVIDPLIFGERHIPDDRSLTVRNILTSSLNDSSLRSVCRAISWGVIANLRSMTSRDLPCALQRIVGSGGALVRNGVMRHAVEALFGLPLHVDTNCGSADSAVGAAMATVEHLLKDVIAHA